VHHIAVISEISPIKIIEASQTRGKVVERVMDFQNPIFCKNPFLK
jgi:hypothetical protein